MLCALLGLTLAACSDESAIGPCPSCPDEAAATAAALAYIEADPETYPLRDSVDDIRAFLVEQDDDGFTEVSFQQYYRDVPVFNGRLVARLNPNLTVLSVTGTLVPGLEFGFEQRYGVADAIEAAAEHFIINGLQGGPANHPELTVLRWLDHDRLCWRFTMRATNVDRRVEYFIDTRNLAIALWRSLLIVD